MKFTLLLLVSVAVCGFAQAVVAADKRAMTLDDLFALKRVADPQISPDGKQVAYQVGTVDMDANKIVSSIWLAATDGKSPPRQLTNSGKRDAHPRWSPDGKQILFESNRSGSSQLWLLDMAGGEATQITDIASEASGGIWSPDGKRIVFVSAVYPEYSELPFADSNAKNKERNEQAEKSPVKARVFTKLFFRHWDSYVEGKRQHLFVCDVDGKNCHDATPGDRDANPTSGTFSSGVDTTFSPDSAHLVFTATPTTGEAWTTNYDICRVTVDNKSTDWETLTKDNEAADSGPQFSPDGTKLAYRSQKTAGYEADKWDILVVDAKPDGTCSGEAVRVLPNLDVSPGEFAWYGNSELAVAYESNAHTRLMTIGTDGEEGRSLLPLDGYSGSISVTSRTDSPRIAFTNARMNRPAEVFAGRLAHKPGSVEMVSHANDKLLSQLDLPQPESVQVPVEGDVKMQMWLLKPPGFDSPENQGKKWPVVYLVHGGPQGAWEDGWSWRWNPSMWAAQGYVIALPNPRGSTGFGQKFVDEISGDWGGKCYRDLVAGLDYVEQLDYVDKNRIAGAGASFGGYMMDWFAVNDIAPRFQTLITHCGVWDFESMWGTTEELWFDEYEHGGLPWEKPGKYREFSPHIRAGELAQHKVPMLVIHNDLDFRVPIGQGHELFTALQRQGVPSRMVNFPDEGHWVLKPQNSKYWHEEVFGWLGKYVPARWSVRPYNNTHTLAPVRPAGAGSFPPGR